MKKRNKYKLTPDVDKQLENTAKILAPFQRRDSKGELMFRVVTKYKSTSITGDKKQTSYDKIQEPIMVNHLVNLREIFQHDGLSGVNEYVKFFTEEYAKQKQEAIDAKKKEQETITEQPTLKILK